MKFRKDQPPENEIARIEREMTEDQIFRLLEIKLSPAANLTLRPKDHIPEEKTAYQFIYVVTANDFSIYIDNAEANHQEIREKNGIEWKDVAVGDGVVEKVYKNNYLTFGYHVHSDSKFRRASERKITELFRERKMI